MVVTPLGGVDTENLRVIEQRTIDGKELLHCEAARGDEGLQQLWLDPAHNFLVRRDARHHHGRFHYEIDAE